MNPTGEAAALQRVPVMDVRAGVVVRARRGERATYAPIQSGLCAGAEPVTVARALLARTGASTLYLADLDVLQGGAVQQGLLRQLLAELPGCQLWLDAGFRGVDEALRLRDALGAAGARVSPVFGSESLASLHALAALSEHAEALGTPILSLDRRGAQTLDPAGCWQAPELWPQRVIVMTLERVGSCDGPDLQTLPALRARAPQVRGWIGSGGVRDAADWAAAAGTGAQAWLVASALHDGRL